MKQKNDRMTKPNNQKTEIFCIKNGSLTLILTLKNRNNEFKRLDL
jgi:hypothetical protein